MAASEVRIVAFGRPERDDAVSAVLSAAAQRGARTRLVTSAADEDFATMDHGAIDWRGVLDNAHWLVSSASTSLEGTSPRYAWGAAMTFGELEGARTVMLVDMASDPSRLAESWGAVIGRIRQVHVLFIAPEAIDALSALEEVSAAELLQSIRHRSPEQGAEFRLADNAFGPPGATDMMVQTNNPVRGGHDHVQIMGDQQDAAALAVPDVGDQVVERHLAIGETCCGGETRGVSFGENV
mgnify:CR=1 FL=1